MTLDELLKDKPKNPEEQQISLTLAKRVEEFKDKTKSATTEELLVIKEEIISLGKKYKMLKDKRAKAKEQEFANRSTDFFSGNV